MVKAERLWYSARFGHFDQIEKTSKSHYKNCVISRSAYKKRQANYMLHVCKFRAKMRKKNKLKENQKRMCGKRVGNRLKY